MGDPLKEFDEALKVFMKIDFKARAYRKMYREYAKKYLAAAKRGDTTNAMKYKILAKNAITLVRLSRMLQVVHLTKGIESAMRDIGEIAKKVEEFARQIDLRGSEEISDLYSKLSNFVSSFQTAYEQIYSEAAQIEKQVDIEKVGKELGIELRKGCKWYFSLCPHILMPFRRRKKDKSEPKEERVEAQKPVESSSIDDVEFRDMLRKIRNYRVRIQRTLNLLKEAIIRDAKYSGGKVNVFTLKLYKFFKTLNDNVIVLESILSVFSHSSIKELRNIAKSASELVESFDRAGLTEVMDSITTSLESAVESMQTLQTDGVDVFVPLSELSEDTMDVIAELAESDPELLKFMGEDKDEERKIGALFLIASCV